jgi:hypothetical protein
MPIFIQWKWKEETKTFLVIFHIYDDYSRANIRARKMRFECSEEEPNRNVYGYFPEEFGSDQPNFTATVHTWAPSHSEMALLMNVLCYANIINGLKEYRKRKLRGILEMHDALGSKDWLYDQVLEAIVRLRFAGLNKYIRSRKDRTVLIGYESKSKHGEILEEPMFCVELCEEYIDYLKEVLEPDLRT